MTLELIRRWFTDKSTIGELFIEDVFFCYTLEDKVREEKIKGKTAIPYGTYKVVIDLSNRFQRLMPHILDVPNFEGIRIHSGNTDKDTEGCIIVGMTKSKDFVGQSREAFNSLFEELTTTEEEITIEITGG
jgi:hypothetical protein